MQSAEMDAIRHHMEGLSEEQLTKANGGRQIPMSGPAH
jgi:hypothetical protein